MIEKLGDWELLEEKQYSCRYCGNPLPYQNEEYCSGACRKKHCSCRYCGNPLPYQNEEYCSGACREKDSVWRINLKDY